MCAQGYKLLNTHFENIAPRLSEKAPIALLKSRSLSKVCHASTNFLKAHIFKEVADQSLNKDPDHSVGACWKTQKGIYLIMKS